MRIYKDKLKNNLRFLIIPNKALPNFTAIILVGAGSRFETDRIAGISHFLEHMFFKGTKKRPSTLFLSSELDSIGAEYNAFTGKEYTGYYAKAAPEHLNFSLEILSDMFFNSRIKKKEIDRERGVITEEVNMYQDTPLKYVSDLFDKIIFKGKPLGRLILGDIKSISNINRKEMLSYLKSYYTVSNTIVCLAGNIDFRKARTAIKKYFNKKFDFETGPKKKQIYIQKEPRSLVYYKKTNQTHLIVGVRGYSIFNEKRFAAKVLATILGGNMSSRLFIKIRERLGLAYYIKTEDDNYLDTGTLATQAGVPNKKAADVARLILKEYKNIAEKGAEEKELNRAKEYLKGKIAVELDESDEVARWVGIQEISKNAILTPREICGKIDLVNKEDIRQTAREVFRNDRLNLAVVGPFKNKEKFQKMLKF